TRIGPDSLRDQVLRPEDLVLREVLPRARAVDAGQLGVGADGRGRDLVPLLQVGDQGLGRGDLLGCGRCVGEGADQADADAVLVDVGVRRAFAMKPVLLVRPAPGDLDLAVGAAGAVADDEVVAAAVPALDLAMLAVDLLVAPLGLGAVVDYDELPG